MDSEIYRERLDKTDEQILQLFAERMKLSAELSENTNEKYLTVTERKKERQKLMNAAEKSPEEIKDYATVLYSLIFELCRSYKSKLNGVSTELTGQIENAVNNTPKLFPEYAEVACQGVEGANSQYACDKLFRNANITYFSGFDGVFSAIESGKCRYGVVPVENSNAGSVNSVYDLMMHHHFNIVRSVRLKIDHNLLAKPGTKLENIREIYSHEQAISQCSEYLGKLKNVKVIACENTAVAAKMVSSSDRDDIAALASRPCMIYYDLECLDDAVQNTDNNYTRFICISKNPEIYPGADRTSLMLTLSHEPGSLYKLLLRLYALDINLIKLESRPLPNRGFEFMFYFDLDCSIYSPKLLQLIGELPYACESFTYLGSYSEII